MTLPASIQAFFDADNGPVDGVFPVEAFAPDAVVTDEGQTYVGRDAITAWWRAAKAKSQHTTEPCGSREERGLNIVRARVTGQFPGSPVVLSFAFRLKEERIAALEIVE